MRPTSNQTFATTILKTLIDTLTLPKLLKDNQDAFQTLIITILSQNTADTNTERAFNNLSKKIEITPKALTNADSSEIEKCIYIGGLHKNKTRTIKNASKIIAEKYNGSLNSTLSKPLEEARKNLIAIPGVGPKTADVVLLFSANKPTIPIDTHVNRVSKRIGLAPKNGGYDAVRLSLQSSFKEGDYLNVHLLFIALGRKYCKAKNPLCHLCPIRIYCLPSENNL